MRELRRQNRSEDVAENASVNKKIVRSMKYKSSIGHHGDDLFQMMEAKMKALEEENSRLKDTDKALTKNEEKLLSAIKSERINQDIDNPVIGRSKLIKKYSINSKYMDDAIKGLELKGIIERVPVKYSDRIMTNSWRII